ncbi:prepilin-type N-terminal cleavage/methylation domain-containing protein [Patescibacteria group bacterium]|nr:prepilin-type N-terminal cleavage/methylation domain-containing protein [Patescibacteria group bacterium]
MTNKKPKQHGFTLIELLITVSVITVGIVAAFTAVQQGISVVDYSRSRLTAAFLAQEGAEIIKNIRDTNLLEGRTATVDWNEGIDPGASPKEYEVVYDDVDTAGVNLASATCSPNCDFSNLRFLKKIDNVLYNYSIGNDTRYKRKVRIEKISNEHLRLTIVVYWTTKKGSDEFQLIQEMYKWW